jgi:hypothetical protein
MVTDVRAQAQRHDRWVSWVVIALFVVALVLGWVVKTLAESRYISYNEAGIQTRYPEGWIKLQAEPPAVLQVADKVAGARTTLTLERRPLPGEAPRPLQAVQQTIALERGRNWMAYRVLETEESVLIAGREAMHITFAYVDANPNRFMETTPVVMRGEDYLIPDGNQAYVFTLTAAEAEYAGAQRYLRDLVQFFQK